MPPKAAPKKPYVERKDAYHLCARCPGKAFDRLKMSKTPKYRAMSLENHIRKKHPDVKDWRDLIGTKIMVERNKGIKAKERMEEALEAVREELDKSEDDSDKENNEEEDSEDDDEEDDEDDEMIEMPILGSGGKPLAKKVRVKK